MRTEAGLRLWMSWAVAPMWHAVAVPAPELYEASVGEHATSPAPTMTGSDDGALAVTSRCGALAASRLSNRRTAVEPVVNAKRYGPFDCTYGVTSMLIHVPAVKAPDGA